MLAPELDLRSGSVGANFSLNVSGAELAPAEHRQHLAGDSGHVAHIRLDQELPRLIEMT